MRSEVLTLDGHVTLLNTWVVNEAWFSKLAPAYKQAILEAAEVSMLVNRGMAELSDALGIKELAEKGMQIYTPNAEELKAFKDATQPSAGTSNVVKDATWVDRILNEAAQAEADLAAIGQ